MHRLSECYGRHVLIKIAKYQNEFGTRRWIDVIDDICQAFNTKANSRLAGFSPAEINPSNQNAVLHSLYTDKELYEAPKFKLDIGDRVVLTTELKLFRKSRDGYMLDNNVYKVVRRIPYTIPKYVVTDVEDDMEIKGSFYAEQLIKLSD